MVPGEAGPGEGCRVATATGRRAAPSSSQSPAAARPLHPRRGWPARA